MLVWVASRGLTFGFMKTNVVNCLAGSTYWLALICVMAGVVHSENAACLSRTVLVGVSGEPSEGWTAADLKVAVGGKGASIQSVTPAGKPPRVIILLDVSANYDQSTWAAARETVDEFLAGFPFSADLTLVTFDEKVLRVVHETDRAALQGIVGEMFPSGKRESEAGLADAIKQASVGSGAYREGDAEFLVTTGDQIRKETEQVLSQQRAAGIRFFGASFDQSRRYGPDRFGVGMTIENYSPLEAAARASGGGWTWFDMSSPNAVASLQSAATAGKSIAAQVRNYLVLKLQLASPIAKPEKLKIESSKGEKGKTSDRFTTHPQELFPCE